MGIPLVDEEATRGWPQNRVVPQPTLPGNKPKQRSRIPRFVDAVHLTPLPAAAEVGFRPIFRPYSLRSATFIELHEAGHCTALCNSGSFAGMQD